MDFDPTPYSVAGGLVGWLKLVGVLGVIGLLLGLLGAFISGGSRGMNYFQSGIAGFFQDILSLSPRRVAALASLTIKEALRRKALLVFVVFAVLLMFGGWFLTNANDRTDLQKSVHVTFMLTTISWLILPVVMFLSCWGIPEDIRVRSLHTVVTKPARRVEIVLGRMLGFMVMSTGVLVLMAIVGGFWIQRQYPAVVDDEGNRVDPLACRVPAYGGLHFLNNLGLPTTHGINVGDPWMYRSFVAGNSRARAVWRFPNVNADRLGDELRLESRFEAFRTIKGNEESILSGIEAQYTLVNNIREDAFSSLGVGASFRPVADALRAGQFQNASDLLLAAAERMKTSPADFPLMDCRQLHISCDFQVIEVLETLGADFADVTDGFRVLRDTAKPKVRTKTSPDGATIEEEYMEDAEYEELSRACSSLAEVLKNRAADLMEVMPAIEVPLEPFRVTEYHEGEDYITYPRSLSYAADYETEDLFLVYVFLQPGGKLLKESKVRRDLQTTCYEAVNKTEKNLYF